jgi:hypothetical protein
MDIRTGRGWLKRLIAAAAFALALVPLAASGHSGHGHDAPESQATAEIASVGSLHGLAHGWSSSCPGSPGSSCCCGGLTACPTGARVALVHASAWIVFFFQPARERALAWAAAEPLSRLPASSAHPRAPPFFS